MKSLVVIDFDRTLFDNHEFFQDFSTILASYYEINGEYLHELSKTHDAVRSKATGIFSAFDEIRHTQPEIDIEHLKQTTRRELAGRTYLFADALPFIESLKQSDQPFVIMTVGTEEYQCFKAEFTPRLDQYEFIVTQLTKALEIKPMAKEKGVSYDTITLIDDRGDTFDDELRQMGVRGVRLRRVDSQYQDIPSPAWVEEVSSLGEIVV